MLASQYSRSPPSSEIASGATRNGTSLTTQIVREPRPVAEHRHEGEQIERERQHPEQRRGGDVGRDVGRHRDDQAGRDGGKRDPGETVARRRPGDGGGVTPRGGRRRAPRSCAAMRDQHGEARKADRPDPCLPRSGSSDSIASG